MADAATECLGILAAGATLAAFCAREMILLRLAAIAANVLFIAYAASLGLRPVLYLHCLLLPLNLLRLAQCLRLEPRLPAARARRRRITH